MSKAIWITTGVAAAAIGMTAIVAQAERGSGEGRGARSHEQGHDYRRHDRRGRHDHRRGGRREVSKEDFDAKTRSRFAKWDTNSDGVVGADEAEARISRRIERRFSHRKNRRMDRMLRRLDTDRDGKITRQEMEARVTERFKRMDLTSDGRITDDDLPPMLRDRDFLSSEPGARHRGWRRGHRHGGRGRGGRRMMRQFAGADTDKDGVVTLQEMQDRAAKRFQRFDRNQDDTLDEADRAALIKQTVDYRVLRFMHRFGASKKGELTLAQFTKHRDERFARMDIDGDGVLKGRELRRHRGRGGKRHGRRGYGQRHGEGGDRGRR